MRGRLIIDKKLNGAMNMAIDEALIDSNLPVVRFYGWMPAAISLGAFQDIGEVDLEYCKSNGIDVVRRISGGSAVLHDDELTYSFIIDEKYMPKGIVSSYKVISKGIVEGLKLMGINAMHKSTEPEKINTSICYAKPSWYEIIADGKKIAGSAQKRTKGKILQHGSILISLDEEKYAKCLGCDTISLKDKATSIKSFTDAGYDRVLECMKKGFLRALSVEFIESDLTPDEKIAAEKLFKDKYNNWRYTASK